ncbi:fibrocystin-L-like protein [Rhodotorula toruloides]|uniref:Fibrocystin-L-like protein n=1 Tax=Rhodotorula toruloides TaxID=5286 RepID=A0A511KCN2_RHOTO|nr:fibrocystin-L-like protein [Rhodotorula toruloides]
MLVTSLILLGLTLSTTSLAANPQLVVSPGPSHHRSSTPLTPPQTNALVAHLLGVSRHTTTPTHQGAGDQLAFLGGGGDDARLDEGRKVVVVLECGKGACEDALPASLSPSSPDVSTYTLPTLPTHSYTSLFALHLSRLARSYSAPVTGLQEFVDRAVKGVRGWQGWVEEELGGLIGWEMPKRSITLPVEPTSSTGSLLTDLDFLSTEPSAKELVEELQKLVELADSHEKRVAEREVVVVHLKGLKSLSAHHGPNSPLYQRASILLSRTLSAFLSTLSPTHTFALLLPDPAKGGVVWLRKREGWLKRFLEDERRERRYGSLGSESSVGGVGLKRRSVFSPRQTDSGSNGTILVPSSHTCFPTLSSAQNATARCLDHGSPVRGVTTRKLGDGEECWVCKCEKGWSGQGCEKEDRSSPFALLFLTTLALLALIILSVSILAKVGSAPLPGTLGAVGGGGEARLKRD